VEERARYEMGMVKDSEVFVQFVSPNSNAPVNSANVPGMNGSTRGQVSAAPLRVVPNPVSRSKQELRELDKKAQKEKAAEAKKKQQGAAQ